MNENANSFIKFSLILQKYYLFIKDSDVNISSSHWTTILALLLVRLHEERRLDSGRTAGRVARGLPGAGHPPPLLLHRLPAEPGAAGAGAGGGAEPDEVEEQENKDEVDGHVTGQEGGERGGEGRGSH